MLPVFDHQEGSRSSVRTRQSVDGVPFGVLYHGGAGAPGVSPTSGYLDIGNLGSAVTCCKPGPATVVSAFIGGGTRPARLDALLVQPEIEQLLLAGSTGEQGLLRSWATERRVQRVNVGTKRVTAYAYDRNGRLVETRVGRGTVDAPVEPYGFTYLVTR